MTYEQSLKNIELLKNLVWPLNFGEGIYFKFVSETVFDIIYDKQKPSAVTEQFMCDNKDKMLPVADIVFDKDDHTIFSYYDATIYFYQINLTTGEILYFMPAENIRYCSLNHKAGMRALMELFDRIKL